MQEKIFTPEQVGQILQVHQFTVLKFIKQGRLNASKIGRVYRIRESDLEEFLDSTSKKIPRGEIKSNNKNKNKTTQNFPADQTEAEKIISSDRNATSDSKFGNNETPEELTNEPKLAQKVEITEIENGDHQPKQGGQDTYYILR